VPLNSTVNTTSASSTNDYPGNAGQSHSSVQMPPSGIATFPPQPGIYYAPPAPGSQAFNQAYIPGATVIIDERQQVHNRKDKTESLCAW
jgi:hypothetical protein